MALSGISDIYSDETKNAQKKLTEHESAKPGEYKSQYSDVVSGLLNQIVNRKAFSYDFNSDPLYQQYKDQYTTLGKNAMLDTVAAASTMTGGFGNSYATTAGAQANQQYLQRLNDRIPELYNAAMNKYAMETEDLYNKFSAVGAQDDREYGRYRDDVADWQTDRDYYYNKYNNSVGNDQYVSNYNYQTERDRIADEQWQQQYEYQQSRDRVADEQWQQQFDYQKQQDAQNYALQQAKASGSSSGSSGSGSSSSGNASSSKSNSSGTKSNSSSSKSSASLYTSPLMSAAIASAQMKNADKTADTQEKIASFIANRSAQGNKAVGNYLASQVNSGVLSVSKATSILNKVKK